MTPTPHPVPRIVTSFLAAGGLVVGAGQAGVLITVRLSRGGKVQAVRRG